MKHLIHQICQALERRTRPRSETVQPLVVQPPHDEPAWEVGHAEAVQSLLNVDAYRRQLADDQPDLDQALGGIEATLARQLGRDFRRFRG